MLVVAAALAAGIAEAARGPAVRLTAGEFAGVPRTAVVATAVARSGRQLVVWRAATQEYASAQLWGRVVGADGVPDSERFQIALTPGRESVLDGAVAARGKRDEFLVAWTQGDEQSGNGVELLARRIGGAGSALSEPFVVASRERFSELGSPAITYGGRQREFVVAFRAHEAAGYAVYMARIAAGGSATPVSARIAPRTQQLLTSPFSPSVAYDSRGGGYLVAWNGQTGTEQRNLDRDVYARALPVASDGRLGRTYRVSPPGTSGGISLSPDVVYSLHEREFAVAWTARGDHDDAGIAARRVGADARPRGQAAQIDDGGGAGSSRPDLAVAPGGHYLVAFNRYDLNDDDRTTVLARRLGPRLKVGPLRTLSTGAATSASGGALAYSIARMRFVVAWSETRGKRDASYYPPKYDVFTRQL